MIKYIVRYLQVNAYHNKYDEKFDAFHDYEHAKFSQKRLIDREMKDVQIFKLKENQTND